MKGYTLYKYEVKKYISAENVQRFKQTVSVISILKDIIMAELHREPKMHDAYKTVYFFEGA